MPTRSEIVAAARRYEGVRFAHQGRQADRLDCAGLLVLVARDLGIEVLDDTTYDRVPDTKRLRQLLNSSLRPKPKTEVRPGDVALFADPYRRGHTYRLGIVTDSGFIHATAREPRGVVEIPWAEDWSRAVRAVFEYPGVED